MKKGLLIALAVALILSALFLICHRAGPVMDSHPSSALAEILAGEAGNVLNGTGKIVVVGRAADRDNQTAGHQQILCFKTAIESRASLKLVAIEWLPPEPRFMRSGTLTAEQLFGLIEKYPATGAFVVFAGLPALSPPITDKLRSHPVKLMAVCGYSQNTKAWLQAGILAAAVVPRFEELSPTNPAPKTTQEWFQQEFSMLTADNAGQWPF